MLTANWTSQLNIVATLPQYCFDIFIIYVNIPSRLKQVSNPEAILLDTHDFQFSIAFVKFFISALYGCNTTAIFVQDFAMREKCMKCIPYFFKIFLPILQNFSNIRPRFYNMIGILNTKLYHLILEQYCLNVSSTFSPYSLMCPEKY